MRQIEKSKNVVNPWENGNDITKMSSISVTKHKEKDACPYKRYFTFFEKYGIIFSPNNFQKLFLQKAVRELLQLA